MGEGRGERDRDRVEKSTADQTGIRGLTATGLFADLFSPKLAAVNMELKINLTKVRVTPFVRSQESQNQPLEHGYTYMHTETVWFINPS